MIRPLLFLASWVCWAAEKRLPLPSRALPWARAALLGEMTRYQATTPDHEPPRTPWRLPLPSRVPYPVPFPRPVPPPPAPPAYPPPEPSKPRPPLNSDPPPLAARRDGYASSEQMVIVHQFLFGAATAGAIQETVARVIVGELGPSPSTRAVRSVLVALLLDLAGRGHDALYCETAALELELAGEVPAVCRRLRSGAAWRADMPARGAA